MAQGIKFAISGKGSVLIMFTGIIEETGRVEEVIKKGTNLTFGIQSPISSELHADQSVSHDGVCLTVERVKNGLHYVTAVQETLTKSRLGDWKVKSRINLERSMVMNARLDGHIVQGHVDITGTCTSVQEVGGSWLFDFSFPESTPYVLVEKGSVCINGVSLTCFDVTNTTFRVTIIPYTFKHTNFGNMQSGDRVNLEFDILGKYVQRILEAYPRS